TTTAETTTAVSTTETAATTAAASSTSAAKRVELDYTPEGADLSVFHYNEDGAVVFDVPIEGQSDATLMAAAQALFQSAHEVNSPFAMGSFPYTIDTNKSVTKTDYLGNENEYFLITDEDINSLDDIIADYQKVFSPKYSYNMIIDTFFTEEGGRVYCICGGRGSDIEYVGSEIISYDGTDGDELMFTVRNHYDGTQWGYDSFDADHDFTAVVDSDGIWRAGKFIQPD
ncbi:MAG: hypothetical protein Q4A05_11575, partial [Ruminococcus sp.]|nr:hypothetical protein [Ruminococcus sp.]